MVGISLGANALLMNCLTLGVMWSFSHKGDVTIQVYSQLKQGMVYDTLYYEVMGT